MSAIQQIQEKYSKLMAVIIAIALIIFVVMLAFENGGSLFSSQSTKLGSVNGKSIDINEFETRVALQEQNMENQLGASPSHRQQALTSVWQQEVNNIIMTEEYEKVGVMIGKKEWGDMLYGENAPQDLKQQFTDPKTGVYNGQQAKQQLNQMLKKGTTQQKNEIKEYFRNIELVRLNNKYTSFLVNSINYPKWFIEKQNAENSQIASIAYVKQPYTIIPDSSVSISNKEIDGYIAKNKEQFKQKESRDIAYLAFSTLPVKADSMQALSKITELKVLMDSTKDMDRFLQSQGITANYDGYIAGDKINKQSKGAILATPVGTSYGPYLDGTNYEVAKILGRRNQPDTVKIRHILIATHQRDQKTGTTMVQVRDTVAAKKTADSVQAVVAAGSRFDSLCLKISDDPGSKEIGGVIDNIAAGSMVPEFNDFIFGSPIGARKVVKTMFGYHYVEILSQKGSTQGYKIAFLPIAIETSAETDAAANNAATLFAGDSRNQKEFEKNAEKLFKEKGKTKLTAENITPEANSIQGLGTSRSFIKTIYDAKLGTVLKSDEVIGDNYVVAVVTGVNNEGLQSASKARLSVEPILKNKKKAEILAKKIGSITTLEAARAKLPGSVIETVDSLRVSGSAHPGLMNEQKIIGAAFNLANKGKIIPQVISGNNGVYVVKVENISTTPITSADVAAQRKARYEQAKQRGFYYQGVLSEAANIKDNRRKFY